MATPEAAITRPSGDDSLEAARMQRQTIRLWKTIGATQVVNRIAAALGSQAMHALQQVRDEKLYLAAGHDTFRDFLDKDAESPMSYDQFNRREKLLQTEGEVVFDLLNSLNVPLKERKLLAGHVEVVENEIIIGEARCRLDDETAIIDLISKQHSKLQEQERTTERGKKDVEKLKRRADEAEKRATIANPTGTPTGQALLTAAGALTQLCEALEAAPPEEKDALKDQIFDLMSAKQLDLSVALGVATKEEAAAAKADDDEL